VTGLQTGAVKRSSLERVTVDTTVQNKAVHHPTDSRLYNRSRERLVRLARQHDLPLRQSYARLGLRAELKVGRYLHAQQGKRAQREIKRLKKYLGRVYHDIGRKLEHRPVFRALFEEEPNKAAQLLQQERKSKNKLYSLHSPEVECIAKGKAHKKYEFGVKMSVASTNRDNFVVGLLAVPGTPYNGHTLTRALCQIREVTDEPISKCYVDRGVTGASNQGYSSLYLWQKTGCEAPDEESAETKECNRAGNQPHEK